MIKFIISRAKQLIDINVGALTGSDAVRMKIIINEILEIQNDEQLNKLFRTIGRWSRDLSFRSRRIAWLVIDAVGQVANENNNNEIMQIVQDIISHCGGQRDV